MKIIKVSFLLFSLFTLCGCGKDIARESRAVSIVFNGVNSTEALLDITSDKRFIVILAKVNPTGTDREKILAGSSFEAKYSGIEIHDTLEVYIAAVSQKGNLPAWFDSIKLAKNLTVMKRESKGRSVKFYIEDEGGIWIVAVGDNWGEIN